MASLEELLRNSFDPQCSDTTRACSDHWPPKPPKPSDSDLKKRISRASRPELICMLARFGKKMQLNVWPFVTMQVECIRCRVLSMSEMVEQAEESTHFYNVIGAKDVLTRVPYSILCEIFGYTQCQDKLMCVSRTAYFASVHSARPGVATDENYHLFGFPKSLTLQSKRVNIDEDSVVTIDVSTRRLKRAFIRVEQCLNSSVEFRIGKSIESMRLTSEPGFTDMKIHFESPEAIKHLRVDLNFVELTQGPSRSEPMFSRLESLISFDECRVSKLVGPDCIFSSALRILCVHMPHRPFREFQSVHEINDRSIIKIIESLPRLEFIGDLPFPILRGFEEMWDALRAHKTLRRVCVWCSEDPLTRLEINDLPLDIVFVFHGFTCKFVRFEDRSSDGFAEWAKKMNRAFQLSKSKRVICRTTTEFYSTLNCMGGTKHNRLGGVLGRTFADERGHAVEVFAEGVFVDPEFGRPFWNNTVLKIGGTELTNSEWL